MLRGGTCEETKISKDDRSALMDKVLAFVHEGRGFESSYPWTPSPLGSPSFAKTAFLKNEVHRRLIDKGSKERRQRRRYEIEMFANLSFNNTESIKLSSSNSHNSRNEI